MLLRLLSAALLTCGVYTASAQSTPVPLGPAAIMVPDTLPKHIGRWYIPHYQSSATVADTAAALVSLFQYKRLNAWWYLPIVPVGVAMLQPTKTYVNDRLYDTTPAPAWQWAVGVPAVVGGAGAIVLRYTTYTRRRLNTITRAYEAGQPIPAKLRRKLRAKHFVQAGMMRVAIAQQWQQMRAQLQAPASR